MASRAFLIAQSLNQIEKAYGPNNSILDNCHVRVSFATNDERTAKRVSDALGTATEMKAMKNYAGHRLSPWLGPSDGLALGDRPPVADAGRDHAASAVRRDRHGRRHPADPGEEGALLRGSPGFRERLLPPPELTTPEEARARRLERPAAPDAARGCRAPMADPADDEETTESERRLQPELSRAKTDRRSKEPIENEFEIDPRR